MEKVFKIFLVLLLCISGGINIATATHIVGGGITYKCMGSSAGFVNYQITIEIYQDCLNGIPEARAEDIPAYVGIFSNDNIFRFRDSIGRFNQGFVQEELVPPNFKNECVNNPPVLCLRKVTFTKTYSLPVNASGYRVMYVRCCRNEQILNLRSPGQVGATYICNIPSTSEATCNSSAYFANYPPQIICINNPLVYDHSARDSDGDSISYELCDAYPGGTTTQPKPFPSGQLPPPISTVNGDPPSFGYANGFSPQKPMGGNPVVSINPVTGVISGTPNIQGRYVVSVCAHEWRNGVRINTVRREFQFTVTNCSKAVIANIPQYSEENNTYIVSCKSNTVKFDNWSVGGFNYEWDFGTGIKSTEFEPTYTYPDTGVYIVKLVVNKGSTCPDSISRFVKVYPSYSAYFRKEGLLCPNAEVEFFDMSVATYKPVVKWWWDFGDGTYSNEQNPKHTFGTGGEFYVKMASTSIKGCTDTVFRILPVEHFYPDAGNDTIIVKGEYINFEGKGGSYFEWSPPTYLNTTTVSNPSGFYPDTTIITYKMYTRTNSGCEGTDDIKVWVVGQGSLFVPSAFTPNGDGKNDFFRPMSVGYRAYKYFRVFNRFGELVYDTKTIGDGWDGRYKGSKADLGTYFWMLSAEDKDGKEFKKKGDVVLIR